MNQPDSEPQHRWLFSCTCGFSHISECTESELEEAVARRLICPICRCPLFKPRKLEEYTAWIDEYRAWYEAGGMDVITKAAGTKRNFGSV